MRTMRACRAWATPSKAGPGVLQSLVLAVCLLRAEAMAFPLSLAAERASFLSGQPVYLRMESQNAPIPSLEEGTLLLGIREEGDGERIYNPPLHYRAGNASRKRIRYARIICEEGQLVFRKPGHYRLRLLSRPDSGAVAGKPESFLPTALSDTLGITIRAPVTPEDKRAYALISRNPGEYGLAVYLEGGDQLRDGMAIISELAATNSAYTRIASFVLSSDWSQDYRAFPEGTVRPLDLEKALAWAQWDSEAGAYIPLRNAFRLQAAGDLAGKRSARPPGLAALRARTAAFYASLTRGETAWSHSF
jgi:hypothetical protein